MSLYSPRFLHKREAITAIWRRSHFWFHWSFLYQRHRKFVTEVSSDRWSAHCLPSPPLRFLARRPRRRSSRKGFHWDHSRHRELAGNTKVSPPSRRHSEKRLVSKIMRSSNSLLDELSISTCKPTGTSKGRFGDNCCRPSEDLRLENWYYGPICD